MLPDKKATSYAHDPALGTVVVCCEAGAQPGLAGEHDAQLLLDTKGHLVGGALVVPPRPAVQQQIAETRLGRPRTEARHLRVVDRWPRMVGRPRRIQSRGLSARRRPLGPTRRVDG